MDTVKKKRLSDGPMQPTCSTSGKTKEKKVIAYVTKNKINDVGFDTICEIAKRKKKVQDARDGVGGRCQG